MPIWPKSNAAHSNGTILGYYSFLAKRMHPILEYFYFISFILKYMKNFVIAGFLFFSTGITCFGQSAVVPKYSVSVNPLGILFFGPTIDVGVRSGPRGMFHANYRYTTMGKMINLMHIGETKPEAFAGHGFAIGHNWFKPKGKKLFYYGIEFNYDHSTARFQINQPADWSETVKTSLLGTNMGYRFNIFNNFYVNTGFMLGAARARWDWEYKDPSFGTSDPDPRGGAVFRPFGMLELALGFAIY